MSLGHLESLCYKEISCFKCNFLLWLWADAEICCSVIQEGLRVPRETNLKMFAGWVLWWWKCSWCVLFSTAGPSSTWLPNTGNVASTTEELNFKLYCTLTSSNLNRHMQLTVTVLDSAVLEECFFLWETAPLSPKGSVNPWARRLPWRPPRASPGFVPPVLGQCRNAYLFLDSYRGSLCHLGVSLLSVWWD